MTAPVAQERRGANWVVAFTMPSEYSLDRLPVPDDPAIRLRRSESAAWGRSGSPGAGMRNGSTPRLPS